MSKNVLSSLIVAAVLLAGSAPAQERSEVELNRQLIQTQRQMIVSDNLGLNDKEAAVFWPLFREYRAEVAALGDKQIDLLMDYAKNYETLTPEQATQVLDNWMKCEQEYLKIKMKWIPKFRAVLPTIKVTKFFQIENKLDSIVRYQAADEIPLVK